MMERLDLLTMEERLLLASSLVNMVGMVHHLFKIRGHHWLGGEENDLFYNESYIKLLRGTMSEQ
jgi:hypothetical protein